MQSGKSTILSAVSGKPLHSGIEIVEEIVPVPDERLDWLTGLYQPKKTVHATIDCLDVPGFSFGDDAGRAAARRLIGQIRNLDMFVMVLRAFGDDADPVRDFSLLHTELLLADLELVATRVERLQKEMHKPSKDQSRQKTELEVQLKLQAALEAEQPVRSVIKSADEFALIKSLGLLTIKPFMVVVNVAEDRLGDEFNFAGVIDKHFNAITMCATLESELAQMDSESRKTFMSEYGITIPAAVNFVRSCYCALGLISFLTVGKDEVRAWTIHKGTAALDAAGEVHSDIKRGFIRAETMHYDDLKALGDEKAVKAAGKVRLEGKTYIVQDGDIINFRFNI